MASIKNVQIDKMDSRALSSSANSDSTILERKIQGGREKIQRQHESDTKGQLQILRARHKDHLLS